MHLTRCQTLDGVVLSHENKPTGFTGKAWRHGSVRFELGQRTRMVMLTSGLLETMRKAFPILVSQSEVLESESQPNLVTLPQFKARQLGRKVHI